MKTKATKRQEAMIRMNNYTYTNSKAKRLGTKTKDEWQADLDKNFKNIINK